MKNYVVCSKMTEKVSYHSCCPSNVTSNFPKENNSPFLSTGYRVNIFAHI